jgi:hypothetical protein
MKLMGTFLTCVTPFTFPAGSRLFRGVDLQVKNGVLISTS